MDIFSIISGFYAITPNTTPNNYNWANVEKVLEKISILQYRRKNISPQQKYKEVLELQAILKPYTIPLIINDDIDLAVKVNAFGVHLGKNDTSIKEAKKRLQPNQIIGVSCYNDLNLAKIAQQQGADYVAFGRIFASQTKPNVPFCSLRIITEAKKNLTIPIVGIGGITIENASQVFKAGANAVAMIKGLDDV
jgi:thiamine-phosphate pyrophosphorylase